MEGIELTCFQLISLNGVARSCYLEAIYAAKEGDFQKARELIAEGEVNFLEGHRVHAQLIQQEASGNSVVANLLLIHAEDQLMSAETFKIVAEEFIAVYLRLDDLK
jgi:Phosphotransferase system cellobiose-specific component IIA